MNIKKPDYIGLIKEIETARGKDFTQSQVMSLIDEMKTIEWKDAFRLTNSIRKMVNLPNNTYGLVLSRTEEIKREYNKTLEQQESWKPNTPNDTSPEESKWTMKVIAILSRFKDSENLLIKNNERMSEAIQNNSLLDYLKRSYACYSEQVSKRPELLKENVPFRI